MKSDFYRGRRMAAFFSYSSRDGDLARSLVAWLEGFAGLTVWYDRSHIQAGQTIVAALERAIRDCRAYILLLTPHSVNSSWVAKEHDAAHQQAAENAGFKRIVLVTPDLDPASIPSVLQSITRIELPGPELDGASAAKLLASLRMDSGPGHTEDDIFVTRTWRQREAAAPFADQACTWLADHARYRLIGDEPGQDDDPERLRSIISSCAAYVALVPPREAAELRFLLTDLQVAQACGIPIIVVADPQVIALETSLQLQSIDHTCVRFEGALRVLPVDMGNGALSASLQDSLEELLKEADRARSHRQTSYSVFYATEPGRLSRDERDDINRVIQGITGRRCIFSDTIEGANSEERLLQEIGNAVATIADVSDSRLDPWVFAGAARAARRPLALVCGDESSHQPTLFKYAPKLYRSHTERVGLVHAAVLKHRRLFLNQEVLRWG